MNNIVNRNLAQNLGSNISSTYIPDTGTGQAIAQGVSSLANTFVSIASMYNKEQRQERKDLAEAQGQADLEAYEKAVASLAEYQQAYDLTPTETSIRHAQLQKHFSHVPANKRNQIDNQHMINIQQNLYEAEAKNAIEAQHAAEKAQVEDMRSRFPGIFNNLSWEESVVKAKDMQQYAGVLSNLAAGYGEKDDYSNDMYLAAAKKGVVDEMYNYLGVVSKDTPITADNLSEIELRLQQEYIKNGIDARIATMATEQVLEPYKRVIKNYSETSALSAKALEDAFKAQLSPITRFALNNPQTLQYLPSGSRGLVDAEIVREMETWTESKANSVNDLFSYKDFGTTASKTTPQATTTSFNIGFAIMKGASAEDNEIQRNLAVNTSLKLRDQVNFKEAQAEQLSVPLEGRSFMDAQADYNNNMAITDGQIGLLGAYTTGPKYNKETLERDINKGLERAVKGSIDMYLIQKNDPNPANRAAARDLNAEALATQAGYSVGTLWEDLSSGTLTDHRVIFDEEKGEIRMLEKLRDVELIDRFTGRVLDIDGKKWIDITDQWGIEGATQDTFKANRDKVNGSIDRFCEIEGMSSKECSEYKKNLWRNAAEPFKGQVKTTGGQVTGVLQHAIGAPYEAVAAASEFIGDVIYGNYEGNRTKILDKGIKIVHDGKEYSAYQLVPALTGAEPEEARENIDTTLKVARNMGLNLSNEDMLQIFFTQNSEGFRPKAYTNGKDPTTIGFGTNLKSILDVNKEFLNSIVPDGYNKALKGELKITKEQAVQMMLNSYKEALEFYETTDLKTSDGLSISEVFKKQPRAIQSVLIDMKYNMAPVTYKEDGVTIAGGLASFKNFWKALDGGNLSEAMYELANSEYRTQVGKRSRKNIAALTLVLPKERRKTYLEGLKSRLETRLGEKGKKIVKNLGEYTEQAERLVPEYEEVF